MVARDGADGDTMTAAATLVVGFASALVAHLIR
jgi:hypothetical protein